MAPCLVVYFGRLLVIAFIKWIKRCCSSWWFDKALEVHSKSHPFDPPNTEHYIDIVDIQLQRWWSRLGGVHIRLLALRVVSLQQFFASGYNSMQKLFSFLQFFDVSWFQLVWFLNCLRLSVLNCFEIAYWVTSNVYASYFWDWQESWSCNVSNSSTV